MIRVDYSDLTKLTVSLKKLSDEAESNVAGKKTGKSRKKNK